MTSRVLPCGKSPIATIPKTLWLTYRYQYYENELKIPVTVESSQLLVVSAFIHLDLPDPAMKEESSFSTAVLTH